MSIFTRIRQTRLAPANKIIAPPETKELPTTPLPEPLTPVTRLIQKCAHCGESEATHTLKIGWFYLGKLPFVALCDVCHAVAEQNEQRHHTSQKKTASEHPSVIIKRPRVRTRIERREETQNMRKPSRPLEDFSMNLAEATESNLLTFAEAAGYVDVTRITFREVCIVYGIKPVDGTNLYRKADLEQARADACKPV